GERRTGTALLALELEKLGPACAAVRLRPILERGGFGVGHASSRRFLVRGVPLTLELIECDPPRRKGCGELCHAGLVQRALAALTRGSRLERLRSPAGG